MSAVLQTLNHYSINEDIQHHPAWIGRISGQQAFNMLRGQKKPYLYLIRAGEFQKEQETDYYVTFVEPDLSIRHTSFVIITAGEEWSYFNLGGGGPYTKASIDDVIHLIMHCEKGECTPFVTAG